MKTLTFSAEARSENPTKTVVKARNFDLIIDEPENLAGTNDGATPVEYVLAALSGCLNVVGHMVAKEMGITLRGMKFSMEGDLDPAKLLGRQGERAGFTGIRVSVTADADADAETLAKWLETVENRCPVSDNLMNATPVKISLA